MRVAMFSSFIVPVVTADRGRIDRCWPFLERHHYALPLIPFKWYTLDCQPRHNPFEPFLVIRKGYVLLKRIGVDSLTGCTQSKGVLGKIRR